ncbi:MULTISPECIES: signal peptidase I [unclassified Streptomyces]|uniref:signal peptidase I n=1 Tax=unclassified Streptomyces TaxID=2593676 RepID=UPI0033DE05BC
MGSRGRPRSSAPRPADEPLPTGTRPTSRAAARGARGGTGRGDLPGASRRRGRPAEEAGTGPFTDPLTEPFAASGPPPAYATGPAGPAGLADPIDAEELLPPAGAVPAPTPAPARPPGRRAQQGRADRRRLARKVKRRRRRSAVKEIPLLVGVAVLIALVLKTFLVQAFVIPSGSMQETITIGDRVLVDKLTPWFGSRPHRGDVVVFKDPGGWLKDEKKTTGGSDPVVVKQVKQALTFIGLLPSDNEQDLIKRVVAVGGDTVKCCDGSGRVMVNGTPLDEPYVHPGNPPSEITFEVKVPEGRLFVMGDHRSNSADSRFHLDEPYHGTVSEDGVIGRAVLIGWPFDHWRWLEEPGTFGSVPDAPGRSDTALGTSHRVSSRDPAAEPGRSREVAVHTSISDDPKSNEAIRLPSPAELPLVMGVVGLRLARRGRWHGVRSGCGGFGGRRTIRTRRARGAAGRARRLSRTGSGRRWRWRHR